MKDIILPSLIAAVLAMLAISDAFASEEGRIQHYAYEKPKTQGAAIQLYHENMGIIGYLLEKPAVDNQVLETIHERSYALEAALETLEGLKAYDHDALDNIEHLVHEMHEASEDHEEGKTRDYFKKLRAEGMFLAQ